MQVALARLPLVAALLAGTCVVAACTTSTTRTQTNAGASASSNDVESREATPADKRRRATIRLQLAVGYYQEGKFASALDELGQALALDSSFADAYTVQALVYTELRQEQQAEESFRKALRLAPGNSDLNNNYGWFLCQRGREKESLVFFENALKDPLYTQKGKPLQNAGVCAGRLGDAALSEDYFRRSFEIDPTGTVSAYNLASIYYDRKDYARARFYVGQVNNSLAPTPASLWLGIRVERRLGNRTNQVALENQLDRLFTDSREAQMQKRGNYGD